MLCAVLYAGPGAVPVCGLVPVGGLVGGLLGGLVFGLLFAPLFGLHFLLKSGLFVGGIETRNTPNQGIHRSAKNALVVGLAAGLVGGLVVGLGVELMASGDELSDKQHFSPRCWSSGGWPAGRWAGRRAVRRRPSVLEHLVLRHFLVRNGSAPWDYAKFLDHAAERILLRKVGGGYIFIHRMLLEYFATRYDESSVEATPNAKPLKTSKIILYISSSVALFSFMLFSLLILFTSLEEIVPVYSARGDFWNAMGEYDKAIADFDQAIRLDPKYAAAYNGRGDAWNYKQAYDKAIADYDQVIRLNPKYALTYNNRGYAWAAKGEYYQAIADFDQAIRLNPKYAVAYNNRGRAWNDKGEYDRAIADFDQAIRLDPKHAVAYNGRGDAWLRATCPNEKYRDGKRAVESATRACELTDWKKAGHLDTLAAAYAECGDFARDRIPGEGPGVVQGREGSEKGP